MLFLFNFHAGLGKYNKFYHKNKIWADSLIQIEQISVLSSWSSDLRWNDDVVMKTLQNLWKWELDGIMFVDWFLLLPFEHR